MTKGPKSDDQPASFLHWPIQGFNARKVPLGEFSPHRMGAQGDGHRPVFAELQGEVVLAAPITHPGDGGGPSKERKNRLRKKLRKKNLQIQAGFGRIAPRVTGIDLNHAD